ncbi:unnamed protein product, partial [Sphacelaria rigidula]
KQAESFVHFGGKVSSIGDVIPEIHNRIGQAWACFHYCSRALYNNPCIALTTKVSLLKADVIEVMLHGCVT